MLAGCQFTATGDGETDTETEGTTTGSSSASSGETTPDPSAGSSDTTPPGTTTSDPSTTGEGGSSSSGSPSCDLFAEWVWAADVPESDTDFAPTPAAELPTLRDREEVLFLRSLVGGEGTAAFTFDVPCTDTVVFWALTWDARGADSSNADAYLVGVDADPEAVLEDALRWEYGCDNDASQWRWYRVRDTGQVCEDNAELQAELEEGQHHLRVTNPEPVNPQDNFDFTGIAAVVATNDPAFDPNDVYDPTR